MRLDDQVQVNDYEVVSLCNGRGLVIVVTVAAEYGIGWASPTLPRLHQGS